MGACNACDTQRPLDAVFHESKMHCNRSRNYINMDKKQSTAVPPSIPDIPSSHWFHQIVNDISKDSDVDSDCSDTDTNGNLNNESETSQGEIYGNIFQRSSLKIKTKPNLFRPDTNTSWDMEDINDLQDDIKQELQALVLSQSQEDIMNINLNVNELDMNYSRCSSSNLIRKLSHDWDSDDMEEQENEMKKHLMHLQSSNDIYQ